MAALRRVGTIGAAVAATLGLATTGSAQVVDARPADLRLVVEIADAPMHGTRFKKVRTAGPPDSVPC